MKTLETKIGITLPMPKKIQRKKSNPKPKPKPVCLYCKEESTFDEHTTECEKCGRYQDIYDEFSESD
jgi:hypothetical protein